MTREEQINTAWGRGYEAAKADDVARRAWNASGRKGSFSASKPPYDAGWLYMPWLDGYTAGTRDVVSASAAQKAAA